VIVGIGIDLVDIARIARLLTCYGGRARQRLFTDREVDYAAQRVEPARHFAARLAAKEAAFKALAGNELARAIGWKEIEVIMHADGRPALELHGRARQRAEELRVTAVWVSLTHSEGTAGAVVVLETLEPSQAPERERSSR
jgi:holo-[acyl-carrier protein] synthase